MTKNKKIIMAIVTAVLGILIAFGVVTPKKAGQIEDVVEDTIEIFDETPLEEDQEEVVEDLSIDELIDELDTTEVDQDAD